MSIGNQEGWAPCSYLERLNGEDDEEEETIITLGIFHIPDSLYSSSQFSILYSPFSIQQIVLKSTMQWMIMRQ